MSKRNYVLFFMLMLVIGFTTVSTTLVMNGLITFGEVSDDFRIIFTNARLNGVNKRSFISDDKKSINFTSNVLINVGDSSTLEYEVTNTSRNYDAEVSVTCTSSENSKITFSYSPTSMTVHAGETNTGTFTARMKELVVDDIEVPIACTLTATAVERTELGSEYIDPFSKSGVMMKATNSSSNPEGLWSYRSNITRVEFEDKLIPHETADNLTFDVSEKQDKSVMAYLIPNGETLTTNKDSDNKDLTDTTAYTLYLQGDTGIIANSNSSSLFYLFNNLLEINNFQYLDTSNITNMGFMFVRCSNLTGLDVSHFDTSNVTDTKYMFYGCSNLTNIDLSNFDTSSVTDMNYIFYGCSNLTNIDLSNFDTSNVTKMQSMFNSCKNLTNLDLSNFDTSSVTDMSSMFYDCINLKSLDVSHFDTSNVTNMGFMFVRCSNLTNLDLSNFDTSSVTNMGFMFSRCSSLTSLDVSRFDTSNVTKMQSMFNSCNNLTSLDVSHFDTSNVTDMSSMFNSCNNLTSLGLSNFDTSNVTYMFGMFSNCGNLVSLNLSNFNTSNVTSIGDETYSFFGMFYNCTSLVDLDISNFTFDLIEIKNCAFKSMPTNATIKVKDDAAQTWILSLTDSDRPSAWTTANVVIKEV